LAQGHDHHEQEEHAAYDAWSQTLAMVLGPVAQALCKPRRVADRSVTSSAWPAKSYLVADRSATRELLVLCELASGERLFFGSNWADVVGRTIYNCIDR
jgi:hypothetical protein